MSINFSAKTPNYSASQSSKNKTVTGTPTASPTGTPTCTCGVTGTPTPTVDPTATPTSSMNPTGTPGADADEKTWRDFWQEENTRQLDTHQPGWDTTIGACCSEDAAARIGGTVPLTAAVATVKWAYYKLTR